MYELNKQYGWSKFIILVPSVAIRESFSIYNTQNKSNLVNIKSFANTSNIEVLIMNHQTFANQSEESRKIYQKLDAIQMESNKI